MEHVDRISAEINQIRQALAADIDGPLAPELRAANQALSWAREPQDAAAPFAQIMGTLAAPTDCQAEPRLAQS